MCISCLAVGVISKRMLHAHMPGSLGNARPSLLDIMSCAGCGMLFCMIIGTVQGTMAEYLTLPVADLHLVPDEVPDQDACFAEPLAAACRIAEQQV